MKIRYIEPRPKGATIYEIANLPKLGLPLLAAQAREAYDDVDQRIYCELIRGVEVDWADVESADLVCISTTTNTTLEGYAYADRLRGKGIPVVFGGSHVTFMAPEAIHHADYVIRREGHVGWMQLLEWIRREGGRDELHAIAGLTWLDDEGARIDNPEAPPASSEDLDALPFPALDLLAGRDRMVTHPLMMKWGCPYDCSFCSVIKMFGRKLRSRSVENVMAELRQVRPERVFFYDDIFIVNKKIAKSLFTTMIDEGITPQWTAQIRADSIFKSKETLEPDHELLALMRDSGCEMVYCGFESITDEGLEEYNKKQKVVHITTAIKLLHQYGIMVHGMFVVGADADTLQTVKDTMAFAIEHEVDTLQMMMLTTLPGTKFDVDMRADGRVLTDNYSLYDGHHCIIRPKQMTPLELQQATISSMASFYSKDRAKARFKRNLRRVRREQPGALRRFLVHEVAGRLLPRVPTLLWKGARGGGKEAGAYALKSLSPEGRRFAYTVGAVPLFYLLGSSVLSRHDQQPHTAEHIAKLAKLGDWRPEGRTAVVGQLDGIEAVPHLILDEVQEPETTTKAA
jgi:anaerobic magnesium-protoporphyrin IX monomethyl ester cyclase